MAVLSKPVGYIEAIWRYPVKSMGGESLEAADLEALGLAGDRRFAFSSSNKPVGKPMLASYERTALLRYHVRTTESRCVVVTAPDGASFNLHDPVLRLRLESEFTVPGKPAPVLDLRRSDRPQTDVRPVALLARPTLLGLSRQFGEEVDARRFRANIVLDLLTDPGGPLSERILVGRDYRLGTRADAPQLRITELIPRCRIVSLNPVTAAADPRLLRFLAQGFDGKFGVYASVLRPGHFRCGDPILAL